MTKKFIVAILTIICFCSTFDLDENKIGSYMPAELNSSWTYSLSESEDGRYGGSASGFRNIKIIKVNMDTVVLQVQDTFTVIDTIYSNPFKNRIYFDTCMLYDTTINRNNTSISHHITRPFGDKDSVDSALTEKVNLNGKSYYAFADSSANVQGHLTSISLNNMGLVFYSFKSIYPSVFGTTIKLIKFNNETVSIDPVLTLYHFQ